MTRKNLLIGIAVIAVASGVYFLERFPRHQSSAIQIAPDFTRPQLNGQPITLSDYRGKVVLLDFWATWCEPCRKTPGFVDLQNKYGPQGLQVIAVSMDDSPEPVRDFIRQFKMNYPVVMGDARLGELYGGILGLPIAYVLDAQGRIVARHIGPADLSVIEREIVTLLQR